MMETVFDHSVTEDELEYLFDDSHITKEEYLSYGDNQTQAYTFIYYLYRYRNNLEKAQEYLDKIPNTFHKWSCICYNDIPEYTTWGRNRQKD